MRTNLISGRGVLASASVLIAMGAIAAPATAGHGPSEKSASACERAGGRGSIEACALEQTAGRLQIGGRSFTIGADRPLRDLVEAFACAGYRATTDGRAVSVRVPGRNPAIAWSSDLYAAKFVVTDDCIVVTLELVSCEREDERSWRERDRPWSGQRQGERRGGDRDRRPGFGRGVIERGGHGWTGAREAPELISRIATRIGAFEVRIGGR